MQPESQSGSSLVQLQKALESYSGNLGDIFGKKALLLVYAVGGCRWYLAYRKCQNISLLNVHVTMYIGSLILNTRLMSVSYDLLRVTGCYGYPQRRCYSGWKKILA